MGKAFNRDSYTDKKTEKLRDKERRNARGKRRIVMDKPQQGNQPRNNDNKDYTY